MLAEHIFEERLWGIASENNFSVQVNCKYYLHKLKWTTSCYKSFSNYLLVCNLKESGHQVIIADQENVLNLWQNEMMWQYLW